MPSLAHLDTKNTLNALLNVLTGSGPQLPPLSHGLQSNLVRLTDRTIVEYEAARTSLDGYVADRALSDLFRTFDHLETCVDTLARVVKHAETLQTLPQLPRIPASHLPSPAARKRVIDARNAMQHAENEIVRGVTGHGTGRPVGLIALETTLHVGKRGFYIRYAHLAAWIEQYHALVRGLIYRA
jgi:hypothetical protein